MSRRSMFAAATGLRGEVGGGEGAPQLLPGDLLPEHYKAVLGIVFGDDHCELFREGTLAHRGISNYGLFWWHYYEKPLAEAAVLTLDLVGMPEVLNRAMLSDNPNRFLVDTALSDRGADAEVGHDAAAELLIARVINLFIAFGFSLTSESYGFESISRLVERARSGDIEALGRAFSVDKTVMAVPSIATLVAQYQVSGEGDKLAVVYRRLRPHSKLTTHKKLRIAVRLLHECGALVDGVTPAVVNLLAYDLKLYATGGGDLQKNLAQRVRQMQRKWATQN